MKWSFKFSDSYNGDHVLAGYGETEQGAIRDAIRKSGRGYPFSFGGVACVSIPCHHRIFSIGWAEGAGRRGCWRIEMDTGLHGRYTEIPFTLWVERGELITEKEPVT